MAVAELIRRLRTAGVQPGDSEELRLRKELLFFALALTGFVQILWSALYGVLGYQLSASLPLGYLVLSLVTLAIYLVTLNFNFFRVAQLGLFLFFPFVLQWSIGNFISASGVVLWGLLAPVGAILLFNARESIPWFVAYIVLILASAFFDYQLADAVTSGPQIPQRTSVIFFALNFAMVATIVYLLLRHSSLESARAKSHLEEAHRMLQIEQDRSERLLLNILPGPVAERLKQDSGTIADGFADVTVMFADIVNFTTMAEGMSPQHIFAMLNRVFSSFDALAEQHGLEKIKTIGDAYMVAGGLNDDPERNYSAAIASMAIDMRALLAREFMVNSRKLELRIGIGTGPVIAGVVGKKKFIYDLWGDTVNIASRITAEGGPGTIQADLTTYRRLRDVFDFDPPQNVYLKGKGDTVIYRLCGKKPPAITQPVSEAA
ncbi:MAG: adenylate/guanylate cyclase domain-containing protein [Burkholderiales bacterium]